MACLGLLTSNVNAIDVSLFKRNLVIVQGEKYTRTQYFNVKDDKGNIKQMKMYAEAPKEMMSLERFVDLSSLGFDNMTLSFPDGYEYEEVIEIVGKEEYYVNIYMAKSGVKAHFNITGNESSEFSKWEEL